MTQTSSTSESHAALARAEMLTIPSVASLEALAGEIDHAIGDVESVLQFVSKYGSYIPGASVILGPITELDKVLGIVKSMLDHVPAPPAES